MIAWWWCISPNWGCGTTANAPEPPSWRGIASSAPCPRSTVRWRSAEPEAEQFEPTVQDAAGAVHTEQALPYVTVVQGGRAVQRTVTLGGKALPFLHPDGRAYQPGGSMKPMFDNALTSADAHPDAAIPVEKINGPILLMSGKADALWPSFEMSERIVKRLHDTHFAHGVTHLSYEGAGHLVFLGDPTSTKALAAQKAAPNPMLGGTGDANMAAWTDDWPKALAFFDKALKE